MAIFEFLLIAIIGGVCLASIAGVLGSILLWKKMAFFGETIANSALLASVIAAILGLNQIITVGVITSAIALIINNLHQKGYLSGDTILSIVSHSALAIGLIFVYAIPAVNVKIMAFLFGDILALTINDLIIILTISFISIITLFVIWRPLLLTIISDDLAKVEGVNCKLLNNIFMIILSLLVAVAVKLVGILLVTALLIMPPALARFFSRTPEKMAVIASFVGIVAVISGILSSYYFDLPTGPTIAVASLIFLIAGYLTRGILPKKQNDGHAS